MIEAYKGSQSRSTFFVLVDSTTGLPKTGVAYTDVTASYARSRSSRVAITPVTLASASAAWSSGGFIEQDATNEPGLYRFDVPNAVFVSGVEEVVVTLKVTGCKTEHKGFVLVDWNKQVASIPNAVAGASTGLALVGSAVGSVTGDVVGKVLGGGASSITGVGVNANITEVGGESASVSDGVVEANIVSVNGTTFSGANVPTNLQTIKGQTVTAASGVTFPASIGTSTYAGADTSGVATLLTRIPGTVQPQTGDAYARIGANGASLTAIGDARLGVLTQLAGAFDGSESVFTAEALANAPAGGGGSGMTLAELQNELTTRYVTTKNMRSIAAQSFGDYSENTDHTATTFKDVNDPETTVITSVNTATSRTVTVHE